MIYLYPTQTLMVDCDILIWVKQLKPNLVCKNIHLLWTSTNLKRGFGLLLTSELCKCVLTKAESRAMIWPVKLI